MNERIRLWMIADPRGLSISLVADVWQDILRKHPEMAPFLEQVQRTAEQPDEIFFDPETTAKRATGAQIHLYYRRRDSL